MAAWWQSHSVNQVVVDWGWTLLHFMWQGALLGGLGWFVLRGLRGSTSRAQYSAALIFLVLIAITPLGTLTYLRSARNQERRVEPRVTAQSKAVERSSTAGDFQPGAPRGEIPVAPSVATESEIPLSSAAPSHVAGASRLNWLVAVVLLWLVGVAAMTARLAGEWWSLLRLRRASLMAVSDSLFERCRHCALQMGVSHRWRVALSPLAAVPVVAGYFRPMILLPASVMSGLTPLELDAILLHEFAHIRRHDLLVNWLQIVVETLLFFHPAVWWISGQLRTLREHCCDDLAAEKLGDRFDYAKSLARWAEITDRQQRLVAAATSGSLLTRIRRLVAPPPTAGVALPVWTAVVVVALTFLAVIGVAPQPSKVAIAQSAALDELKVNRARVRIVDAQGKPVAGAEIFLWYGRKEEIGASSAWRDRAGVNWGTMHTSKKEVSPGVFEIEIPRQDLYRFSAAAKSGDSVRTSFSSSFTSDAKSSERDVTIVLEGDRRIEVTAALQGKPIDAIVLRLYRENGEIVHEADPGNVNSLTDEEGRWKSPWLAAGKYELEIRGRRTWRYVNGVVDFLPETERRVIKVLPGADAQLTIEPKSSSLSKEEIDRRWPWIVQGRVVDSRGAPVADAEVHVATGMGTLMGGTRTQTDAEGRYFARFSQGVWTAGDGPQLQYAIVSAHQPGFFEKSLNRQGDYVIARKAPSDQELQGFGCKRERVILPGAAATVDFVLQPAAKIVGILVDEEGKPLRDYSISLSGKELPPASSVYVQERTNAAGEFVMDKIPTDREWFFESFDAGKGRRESLELKSGSTKFPSPGEVRLQIVFPTKATDAKSQLNIELAKGGSAERAKAGIELKILDDATGEPITKGLCVPGIPEFTIPGTTDETAHCRWQTHLLREWEKGQFKWPMERTYAVFRLRIEASGYVPVETELFRKDEMPLDRIVRMKKDAGIEGLIVDSAGKPVSGATIGVAIFSRELRLKGNQFETRALPDNAALRQRWEQPTLLHSDGTGRFSVPTESSVSVIVAVHERGFAQLAFPEFAKAKVLTLEAWASVKGQVLWGGEVPGAGQKLYLGRAWDGKQPQGDLVHCSADVIADEAGKFEIAFLPPAKYQVSISQATEKSTGFQMLLTSFHNLKAGSENRIMLGGRGRPVEGKVTGAKVGGETIAIALEAPPWSSWSESSGLEAYGTFMKSPAGKYYSAKTTADPNGSFRFPRLPAGNYLLTIEHADKSITQRKFEVPLMESGESEEVLKL